MSEKQWSAGTVLGAVALLIVTGCDDGIGPAGSANLAGHRAPAYEFQAHTAPLGARFDTGSSFPERYHGALFVAEHGTEAEMCQTK